VEFEFVVAIRAYEAFVIAETAGPHRCSAAGETGDEALEQLRRTLRADLERTHPVELPSIPVPDASRRREVELDLYRNRAADGEGTAPEYLPSSQWAVVESYGEDLGRIWLPALNVSRWTVASDPRSEPETEGPEEAFRAIADELRRRDRQVALHRPSSARLQLDRITVEFDPADVLSFGEVPGMVGPLPGGALPDPADDESTTLETVATCWSRSDGSEHRDIQPIFGRRDTLDELAELVGGSEPEAVVLVGDPRVGKTSLIQHLAWTAHRELYPADDRAADGHLRGDEPTLGDREVWFADAARLTSLDSPYGGWREQSAEALDELESRDAILYLGRLVETLDAGKSIESDYHLAQFLKPLLDDRRIRLVAEATAPEWNEVEQRAPGFARNFQVLRIDDPPEPEARQILERSAARAADAHAVTLADGSIDRAWRLQNRFTTRGSPLGRAIDFVERTLERTAQAYRDELTVGDVVDHFCEETGLPVDLLRDDRSLELEAVRGRLEERVMGQTAAVDRVADVIGVTKADLGARNRPLGVFFFAGPTGVGKTELAKALADFMFDDERLIRLDMSEYSTPGSHNRLIGRDASETSEPGGDLTSPVRRNPFSVVLLDEIEKADSGVFDMLLQVFGEARLTDTAGRTTRFQNTIIVMTSNLGGDPGTVVGFDAGTSPETWERHFRRAAEDYFRPEFLGRIDQFVPFRPLPREAIVQIAIRELSNIDRRIGLRRLGASVELDDEVAEWVADTGWDERYGARPIERVVEQSVVWTIADRLADADLTDSDSCTVRVSIDSGAVESNDEDPVRANVVSGGRGEARRARERLSEFVRRLGDLRRDLQRYLRSDLFESLEDRVASYDASSRNESFWDDAEAAAEEARRAEEAREIVEPARELADEVAALEDLAREAFHARSTETAEPIADQVEDCQERVESLFLTLLTASYAAPNRAVLALLADHPEHPWRDELVDLYADLAERRDWSMQIWQAIPPHERDRPVGIGDDFERGDLWRTQRAPHGELVLLEFRGRAVRPLLVFEGGRHRRVDEEDSETVEVRVLPPDDSWPHPETLRRQTGAPRTARTWNYRESRVGLGDGRSVPLLPEDPWSELVPHLERRAWEAASWS